MIDFSVISTKLLVVAREGVGSQLSTIGGGSLPAVIKAYGNSPKPDYPFITLYFTGIKDEDSWLNNELISATNTLEYFSNKVLSFVYTVYGDSANKIAHDLHERFVIESVRDDLRATLGAGIVMVSSVKDLPTKLGDKNYVTASEFSLLINIVDTISDIATGIIDNIDINGELYRAEGDPSPLPINISVP